jgi:hypothetical protein
VEDDSPLGLKLIAVVRAGRVGPELKHPSTASGIEPSAVCSSGSRMSIEECVAALDLGAACSTVRFSTRAFASATMSAAVFAIPPKSSAVAVIAQA